ncbi:MAG: class I SAM-dependent methyltransferase [Anaerolineales bacterium]|jgi:2-polyprenyl-3-methyl-5-hydroxy-6-metoxy-1,4-benzoquinol methylase
MQPEIVHQLLALNHQFYQTFAQDFSDTRQRIQPGVESILEMIQPSAKLLDLGCGNGALAGRLYQNGHTGAYVGVDSSKDLVEIAQKRNLPNAQFMWGDITTPDLGSDLPGTPFDFVFCFAVLHHIPGVELRIQLLEKVHALLAPKGRFILSNWQFLESPRLRARIQPWTTIDLSDTDVDAGDYLMDWWRGGKGLRYVHHFSGSELQSLAVKTGFRVCGLFTSDGEEGKLGLYQIWEVKG